jgi:hypothetical protein
VIAKPKFTIVAGGSNTAAPAAPAAPKKTSTTKTYDKGSFSIAVPKAWNEVSTKDSLLLFAAHDTATHDGIHGFVDVLQGSGRGTRPFPQWTQDLIAGVRPLVYGKVSSQTVKEPAGQTVLLTYDSRKVVKGMTVRIWQYYFDAGAQAYVVTFVATPATQSVYAKAFAAAAASFTLN